MVDCLISKGNEVLFEYLKEYKGEELKFSSEREIELMELFHYVAMSRSKDVALEY